MSEPVLRIGSEPGAAVLECRPPTRVYGVYKIEELPMNQGTPIWIRFVLGLVVKSSPRSHRFSESLSMSNHIRYLVENLLLA
jgi:hypothetical protein